jgi:hypothetical protein
MLEFMGVGRSDHVKKLNRILARATEAVGGTLVQNPFFALMGQQQVTVHPVGFVLSLIPPLPPHPCCAMSYAFMLTYF